MLRFTPPLPLIVGISTRALFDLETEHAVFREEGVKAYAKLQRSLENKILEPGTAFEVVKRLLALKGLAQERQVDVLFLSRNSADLSLRAYKSAEHYGLDITRGSFTGGRSVAPFVSAWGVDLFLSNEDADVTAAAEAGTAAARLVERPRSILQVPDDEVRIALDGDSVVFSDESDRIYQERKLAGFMEHERLNADNPMKPGPFGNFLEKLSMIRAAHMRPNGFSKVRIAIVTARNAAAHARVVNTLRSWGTPADEAHFVGHHDKASILRAFGAHIFFDDQERHVASAASLVPAGVVPGPHPRDELIVQAR